MHSVEMQVHADSKGNNVAMDDNNKKFMHYHRNMFQKQSDSSNLVGLAGSGLCFVIQGFHKALQNTQHE